MATDKIINKILMVYIRLWGYVISFLLKSNDMAHGYVLLLVTLLILLSQKLLISCFSNKLTIFDRLNNDKLETAYLTIQFFPRRFSVGIRIRAVR